MYVATVWQLFKNLIIGTSVAVVLSNGTSFKNIYSDNNNPISQSVSKIHGLYVATVLGEYFILPTVRDL